MDKEQKDIAFRNLAMAIREPVLVDRLTSALSATEFRAFVYKMLNLEIDLLSLLYMAYTDAKEVESAGKINAAVVIVSSLFSEHVVADLEKPLDFTER